MNVGDLATIPDSKFAGTVFKVIKVNQVTYELEPLGGVGPKVNCQKSLAVKHTGSGESVDVDLPSTVLPSKPHFTAGQVVRWNGDGRVAGMQRGDLGVVLRDKYVYVQVAKLGGHKDYFGKLQHRNLEVIDIERLPYVLAES